MRSDTTYTYIIRFKKPISGHVSEQYGDNLHYFGITNDLRERTHAHFNGKGSVVTKRAFAENVGIRSIDVIVGNYENKIISDGLHWWCDCVRCRKKLNMELVAGVKQKDLEKEFYNY